MAKARQYLPGTTYMVTRRCIFRKFLLTPSEKVNEIILFCMTRAANKSNIKVHAYCFMSNHMHAVVTDPESKLSDFMHWMNKFIAQCLNNKFSRCGEFWKSGSFSWQVLGDDYAVLKAMTYVIVNPVSAGLVKNTREWPGVISQPEDLTSKEFTSQRPEFFSENSDVPETVSLRLKVPPVFEEMKTEEFIKELRDKVATIVRQVQQEMRTSGRRFMGAFRVIQQNREASPKTPETHRDPIPRVVCGDKGKLKEMKAQMDEFDFDYQLARDEFCAGDRKVVFPPGTYWMRVHYGVCCAASP